MEEEVKNVWEEMEETKLNNWEKRFENKTYCEFLERFKLGEQYLDFDFYSNEIKLQEKAYFWQQREVYNHIQNSIEYFMAKTKALAEPFHIIEALIPYQRQYNSIKNRENEILDRICLGELAVEDGSVDTDVLESEGLYPGKVLVYRQGANPPKITYSSTESLHWCETSCTSILQTMFQIVQHYIDIEENKDGKRNQP